MLKSPHLSSVSGTRREIQTDIYRWEWNKEPLIFCYLWWISLANMQIFSTLPNRWPSRPSRHNTFHPRRGAACWKDWFNRLQINDSFLRSFWLQHLPRYGNYQLTGIYYYIQAPSVWLLVNMCRVLGSQVNTHSTIFKPSPHLGNQCYENLTEFLRWLHNWWIWDHIGVDFGEHIEWFEGTCEYW